MKVVFLIVLMTSAVLTLFCAEALAGLGEPLAAGSLVAGERKVIIDRLARNCALQNTQEEKASAVLDRLPDRELKLLTQNADTAVSGGSNLIWAAYLGWFYISIFIILIVFLVLALFGVGPIGNY